MSEQKPRSLRDIRLQRALDHAPDAEISPSDQTRAAIMRAAHQGEPASFRRASSHTAASPWWRRWFAPPSDRPGNRRAPWYAALTAAAVVALTSLLWLQFMPDEAMQPSSPTIAQSPLPTAAEDAGPPDGDAASAAAQAPESITIADTSSVKMARGKADQSAERTVPAAAAKSEAAYTLEASGLPATTEEHASSPHATSIPPLTATPGAKPNVTSAAVSDVARETAAAHPRSAPAAPKPAKPEPPPVASPADMPARIIASSPAPAVPARTNDDIAKRWTRLSLLTPSGHAGEILARAETGAIPALIGEMMQKRASISPQQTPESSSQRPPALSAATMRLRLFLGDAAFGTLEINDTQWSFTPAGDVTAMTDGKTDPDTVRMLRHALTDLYSSGHENAVAE